MSSVLIPVTAGFVVSGLVTPLAGALARRLGVVDRPGPFKVQQAPVPYLGGLAVFVAAVAAAGASRPAVILPLALALALGVADDLRTLSPLVRVGCEVAVGAVVAALVPALLPGPLGPLATAAAVVLLINAVNLLDGLDGLASGVTMASFVGFAFVVDGGDRTVALAMAGALAGFLLHNMPPARIYLGDGGAYLVGTALAFLLATSWATPDQGGARIGALALVAVPVAETALAIVRRRRSGRPLSIGDRDHVYDQLVARGWSVARTSMTFAGAQAALVLACVIAARSGPAAAAALVGATAVGLLALTLAGRFLTPTGPGRRAAGTGGSSSMAGTANPPEPGEGEP